MHHLQEAAAPVKCPDSVGLVWGASQAPLWSALAFQLGGKAGEELADGRDETPSGGGRAS